MSLSELQKSLPSNNWFKDIPAFEDLVRGLRFNKTETEEIIEKIIFYKDQGHLGRSFDMLTLGLLIDKKKVLEQLKRRGFFRIYNCIDKKNYIGEIANFLLKNSLIFKFLEEEIEYLNSIELFSSFHPVIKKKRFKIISVLKAQKKVIVKSLYSYVDSLFQKGRELPDDRIAPIDQFTNEQIAEAASYIIMFPKIKTEI